MGIAPKPEISNYHFNRGGLVPGSGPDVDSVLAMLTPGEFVLRRGAVEALGVDRLRALNEGRGMSIDYDRLGAAVARAITAAGVGGARSFTFIDQSTGRGGGMSPVDRVRQVELLVGAR